MPCSDVVVYIFFIYVIYFREFVNVVSIARLSQYCPSNLEGYWLTYLPMDNFADDIFRCIFVNENFCILINIALKFVPKGPIDNNPALLTRFADAYMRH